MTTAVRDLHDGRWAWREAGAGPGAPILLLHGLGGSRISWEPQLAGLASSRRVIAWDLPGYGEAPPLRGPDGRPASLTFDLLADAVADFTDSVVGRGAPAHLVGISFGGMIAQYAAVRHPRRWPSLSLLATSPAFGLDGTRPDEWRAARLAPLDAGHEPADFADAVLGRLAGPHISADALATQRAAMARVTGEALRRSIDCLVTHDSRHLLGQLRVPTQCLVGELDDETPVAYGRALADLIPHAVVHVVPHAGHLLNVEAPDAVNLLIDEHVDQHPPSAPSPSAPGGRP